MAASLEGGQVPLADVLRVLGHHGVFHSRNGDQFTFSRGNLTFVNTLKNPVSRKMVHWFQQKFEIRIELFYHPETLDDE